MTEYEEVYTVIEYPEEDNWIHNTVLAIGAFVISVLMLGIPLVVAAVLLYAAPNEISKLIMVIIVATDVLMLASMIYNGANKDGRR